MRISTVLTAVGLAACGWLLLTNATVSNAQSFDHLTCYKVKDTQKFKGLVTLDALQNQFDPSGQCKIIGKAKMFCVPTNKTVDEFIVGNGPGTLQSVPGPEPVPDRICYKVKCPAPQTSSELVSDQFGTRQLGRFKPKLLCTPAVKGAAPTTTTTTTTTTITTTTIPTGGPCTSNSECNANDYCQKADGDCSGSGTCTPKPLLCPDVFTPVCGCDGLSYGNACKAAKAGTNVGSQGACP